MAKKTLNEATIRRFQKLANVAPIHEMNYKRDEDMEEGMYNKRDDEMEEGMYNKNEEYMTEQEEDADLADDPKGEMDAMDDMPADDEGAMDDSDLELTDEEAEAIIALGQKLEAAMGDDDMGAVADMDDTDMGEEDLMEALRDISYVPSQGEIVNEVAQRVARRLKAAKLHEAKLNKALGKRH